MVSEIKRGDPSVRGLSYTPHLKWSTSLCSPEWTSSQFAYLEKSPGFTKVRLESD